MTKRLLCAAAVALVASSAALRAQQQTIPTDYLRLNTGPCILAGVDGSPDALRLTGNCSAITAAAATNLHLAPDGDLVLAPVGVDVLPNTNYTVNLGMLSNKYLTLHAAELWVETLVAQNTIATIGGRVLVAPTNTLTSDLGTGATSIDVKYNNFANGDRIYLEADGKVEFMAVTSSASGSGPYTYSVTRNLDGSGANQWYAGDAALNTGTTGDGFIDLYSLSGVLSGSGPTIVGNVRTGTTYNNIAARWAIGNLNGLYNYGADTYGAAFGDASATNVTVDATNGFRVRSGTTNKLVADTSGNLSIVGDLTVGTAGTVHSAAASALNTGTGFWLAGGTTPEFRVGDPGSSFIRWDGSTLSVVGDLNVVAGGSGRNLIANSTFEGDSATRQLQGWSTDANSLSCAPLVEATGCGITVSTGVSGAPSGSQTLTLSPTNSNYASVNYRALPVLKGKTYRVAFWAKASTTTSEGFSVTMLESSSTSAVRFVRNVPSPPTGDVVFSSSDGLAADVALSTTWTLYEYVYTPGSSDNWASLSFTNASGSFGTSGTYGDISVDSVEVTEQVAGGHIRANSVTADRLSVSTLSAITANMGTVTAGTIDGVTIVAGSGDEVLLDGDGITLAPGDNTENGYKFGGTSAGLYFSTGLGGALALDGAGPLWLLATGSIIHMSAPTVRMPYLAGGGSGYLCIDNNGDVFGPAASC